MLLLVARPSGTSSLAVLAEVGCYEMDICWSGRLPTEISRAGPAQTPQAGCICEQLLHRLQGVAGGLTFRCVAVGEVNDY